MEIKQNPFSVYDFLGYFIPGATLCYLLAFSQEHANFINISTPNLKEIENLLPFVLTSYLAGHILNYISSFTIEKHSVWNYGYPSKYIVGEKHNRKIESKTERAYRFINSILIAPVSIPDAIFGRLLNLRRFISRAEDDTLKTIIRHKIYELLREQGAPDFKNYAPPHLTNYFSFAYHYCVENYPYHFPKMQNYVALYGFLRANCLIFVILFWIIAFHLKATCSFYTDNKQILTALLLTSAVAFILYLGFMKFYRRFCLEVLMALASNYKPKQNEAESAAPPPEAEASEKH